MIYLEKTTSLLLLLPVCALALTIEIARVKSVLVARYVDMVFGGMMRPQEKPPIGSTVVINGATWVLLSALILIFIFPVEIAVSAMVMFMIADAAAALIGRRYGRHHWGTSPKTIEGSVSFFVVAFLCLAIFQLLTLPFCILVALLATLLELTPIPVNDNLYVPLLTAGVIFGILQIGYGQDIHLFL